MTGWLWILADVVGVAILGGFLFYGQRQTAKLRGEETSSGTKLLTVICAAGAVALSLYLLIDASRRIYDLGPCSGTPGDLAVPTTPTKKERSDAEQAGEPAKEGTCRTTVGEKQPGMSHEDCVFIASQIPVLASNTVHSVLRLDGRGDRARRTSQHLRRGRSKADAPWEGFTTTPLHFGGYRV